MHLLLTPLLLHLQTEINGLMSFADILVKESRL